MNEFKLLILGFVLLGTAMGAIGNALWGPRARARKRLDAAKRTTIADREIVTLTGTVTALGELLEAPLSGTLCVLYEAAARVPEEKGRHTAVAFVEQKLVPFGLETAEGMVRVEADVAEVELPSAPCVPRKLDRERAFLLAHELSAQQIRYAGFDELRIVPGQKIRVQGMAIVDLDPEARDERGYRSEAPRRIRLIPHAEHPLTIGRARR